MSTEEGVILQEHLLWFEENLQEYHKHYFMSEDLYKAVHIAIYRHDPMGIGGCSEDEYDPEISAFCDFLERRLYHTPSSEPEKPSFEEIFSKLKEIFGYYFGEHYVKDDPFTIKACELASREIAQSLLKC